MSDKIDEIKSLRERISNIGVNIALTPTDKLVAVTIATTGEMNPAALIEMLGLPKSTLYRSLGNAWEHCSEEIENQAIPMSGNDETRGNDGNQRENSSHQWENSDWHDPCTSRAPKESTNVDTSYEDSMPCAREIDGLNGSTGSLVTQLACTLAGPMGNPDFLTAREIIQSNVSSFGSEKVKVGFADWRIRCLTDAKFRATPHSFGKFVQNARVTPNKQAEYDTTSMEDAWAALEAEGSVQ